MDQRSPSFMRHILNNPVGSQLYRQRKTDRRASIRAHQAQPTHQPVSPTRQNRRQDRMAADPHDTQPDQAAPPQPRRSDRLTSRELLTDPAGRSETQTASRSAIPCPLRDSLTKLQPCRASWRRRSESCFGLADSESGSAPTRPVSAQSGTHAGALGDNHRARIWAKADAPRCLPDVDLEQARQENA